MNLIYCDKKSSNTGRCSRLACYVCIFSSDTGKEYTQYRCEEHKTSPTANKKVKFHTSFTQETKLNEVNSFLRTLIGKPVFSSWHRNKYPMIGKYLKSNGAIMCQDSKGKWLLVYHHQIKAHDIIKPPTTYAPQSLSG